MLKPILIILAIFIVIIGITYFLTKPEITAIGKMPINTYIEPLQTEIRDHIEFSFTNSNLDVKIFPQSKYVIQAKVLSKKRYITGWNAKLSPIDLALGWGDIIEPETLKKIKFRQTMRWYTFRFYDSSLDADHIAKHAANCHIIPATKNIRKALMKIGKGNNVKLTGYLVNVNGSYKNRNVSWNSSRSRTDKGDGACEIIYVQELQIDYRIYK